jgi:hypothetical protein
LGHCRGESEEKGKELRRGAEEDGWAHLGIGWDEEEEDGSKKIRKTATTECNRWMAFVCQIFIRDENIMRGMKGNGI